MKNIILLVCATITLSLTAQSKYETAMTKALEQYKNSKTIEELVSVSALFERIGDAEKDKWLPYYYSALTYHLTSWTDTINSKDKNAEKSLQLIEKAELLEKNNAELFCLRQMVAVSQMTVDPMTRWQTYGMTANKALADAKKADPNNPRPYFLEAQSIFNTPEAFGGGKKNAKPLFEKAVALYATYTLPSTFHPDWGKEDAATMLKMCE